MLFNSPRAAVALLSLLGSASALRVNDFAKRGGYGAHVEEATLQKRAVDHKPPGYNESFRYLSKETQPFQVTELPDIPYDLGEIYSGLIPIDEKDPSRALFFVFQPTVSEPTDEVVIWLNGGPGCSSLEGFLQENGRFIWAPGQGAPLVNPYSWVNLTNVLWVEQPVGTGFSIGKVTATSEEDIAQDFIKFFKNFEEKFGIKNYKIYVTGESYAGRYVPFISAAMLDEKNKEYFDLKGALTYDPCIGSCDYVQGEVPTLPFVQQNNNVFNLNATFMAQLEELDKSCGYAEYRDKYMTFPPSGLQPPTFFNYSSPTDLACDVFDMVITASYATNPCANVYEITTMCPIPSDVLGFPTDIAYLYPGQEIYFNRTDVKKAIHAPLYVDWAECSAESVFVGDTGPEQNGDLSLDPVQHVLPQVIEATNRVLVANGDLDMIVLTNGTLLSIQNMTWNGKMGFQQEPSKPIVITLPDLLYGPAFAANGIPGAEDPMGIMGTQHYERGLMWAQTALSGHMEPQYQPRSSYRHLQWLLGHIEEL